jgi:O-Antigen ligase
MKLMLWLLGGYIILYIYRPWEVFPSISSFQIERLYMLGVLAFWIVWPGKVLRPNRVHFAVLAFTLAVVASWSISPYRDVTWLYIEDYLKVLVFFTLVVTCIRDERDLRCLVWFVVIAIGVYAAHSFREYFCGRYEYRMGFHRLIGVDQTSSQSNMFAGVVVTGLPFVQICWRNTRSLLMRLGLVGFVGLVGMCVALTGSRGGYITLGVFALVQACLSKHRKLAIGVLVGLGVMVSVMMPGMVIDRFMTMFDSAAGPESAHLSAMGRIAGLMAGLHMWSQNPALGTGPMSFILASGLGFQAHNMLGQLVGELGTAGLVAFVSILLCCGLNFLKARKLVKGRPELRDCTAYLVVRATLVILLLHLIYGMGGHNLYRFQWYWAAAFNVGATYCVVRRVEQAALAVPRRQGPSVGLVRRVVLSPRPTTVRPRPPLARPRTQRA